MLDLARIHTTNARLLSSYRFESAETTKETETKSSSNGQQPVVIATGRCDARRCTIGGMTFEYEIHSNRIPWWPTLRSTVSRCNAPRRTLLPPPSAICSIAHKTICYVTTAKYHNLLITRTICKIHKTSRRTIRRYTSGPRDALTDKSVASSIRRHRDYSIVFNNLSRISTSIRHTKAEPPLHRQRSIPL